MKTQKWVKYRGLIGVYKITNLINNKFYIGSSNDIATRLSHHFGTKIHNSGNRPLWRDIKYFGRENFKIDILETMPIWDKNKLVLLEKKYYEELKPQYNKAIPGISWNKGKKVKYSDIWYEKHRTQDYRKKMTEMKNQNGWSKRIKMINRDQEILYFNSMRKAGEYLQKNYDCQGKAFVSKIRECCLGKRKSYYGCLFESVETISKESRITIDT